MEKLLAKFFSILFHPLIMTTLGLLVMFNSGSSLAVVQPEVKRVSLLVVLLFTGLFPLGMVILLHLTRMIRDYEISDKEERVLPIALVIILLLFTFFVMRGIPQLERGHVGYLLTPPISMFLLLILNRIMKPSVHMLGLGGLLGMMLIVIVFYQAPIQLFFILGILASGITGTSRLILRLHTPKELLVGFITGFLSACVIMILFLR